MLVNNNKIELPKCKMPEEIQHTKDSKYFQYHRIISHPSKDCFILKDKIQALIDVGVLHLNEKKEASDYKHGLPQVWL